MARSLIVRLRFPFFRFYARMGDAKVDAKVAKVDTRLRQGSVTALLGVAREYLNYLVKPRTSTNHAAPGPDFHDGGSEYEAGPDQEFNPAGGGESKSPVS